MSSPAEATSANLSPVRIYVIWHPGLDRPEDLKDRAKDTLSPSEKLRLDRGIHLARRIYHWFRMETMDGIPVYFRGQPESGDILPVDSESGVRNYIIPIVDAHMVSSPAWCHYIAGLVARDESGKTNDDPGSRDCRVLPVAVDPAAYNMPGKLRHLNFIRHLPRDSQEPDDMELLSKLTEVLCRDLQAWFGQDRRPGNQRDTALPVPSKIKIFLSHAKADDTEEAIAIKDHIQRATQCEAFFDETDIASGYDFGAVLDTALSEESAGLIVIQGDNYADRPWCRKEIRDFLKPEPEKQSTTPTSRRYFVPPVIVVQTMKGKQLGRTIAELGYSPCVRWQPGAARFVVTTLLREILFGLFYRVLAARTAEHAASDADKLQQRVFINRAPDPVMVHRILKDCGKESAVNEIVHPGYGLSKMESEGLKVSSDRITFTPFLDLNSGAAGFCTLLAGRIIAISAGNSEDILGRGLGEEHIQELLLRLLRSLAASGASFLYAGKLPGTLRPASPWSETLNYTGALLQLLVTERETHCPDQAHPPRLFVPVPWHGRRNITARDIAHWTDICTFVRIPVEDTGIDPTKIPAPPQEPAESELSDIPSYRRRQRREAYEIEKRRSEDLTLAVNCLSLSAMRRRICDIHAPLPYQLHASDHQPPVEANIVTFAHILIGGKTRGFSGTMPGVFEEALYAFEAKKPVFLISQGAGAAALLARWLLDYTNRPEEPPHDFTVAAYGGDDPDSSYGRMLAGLEDPALAGATTRDPSILLSTLWKDYISKVTDRKSLDRLLNNKLGGKKNEELLRSTSSHEIASLVHESLSILSSGLSPG